MDDLQRIPLEAIAVRDRLRAVDPDHVAHIAASIAQIGQQTPIHLAPPGADGLYLLLAGAHRLEALRTLGQATALALIVDADELDERLIEIDENLMRRELSELDRAVFLAERKAIYERRHPETKNGARGSRQGRNHSGNKMIFQDHLAHGVPAFHRDAAKKLGLAASQIRKLLARARIEPDLRALLASSRWAEHGPTLDALARYQDAKLRRGLIRALTRSENPARSLAAAEAEVLGRNVATDEVAQFARLVSAWRKATPRERDLFLRELASEPATLRRMATLVAGGARRETDEDDESSGEDRVLQAFGRPRRTPEAEDA